MSDLGVLEYFAPGTARDFFRLMCGERLGGGSAREVFVFDADPKRVLKFETKYASFQNVFEHDTWQWLRASSVGRWLAPCYALSGNGTILMQARTSPLPFDYKLPKKVPALLGDLKSENFGLFEGRLVAHDYGTSQISMMESKSVQKSAGRMVAASWR